MKRKLLKLLLVLPVVVGLWLLSAVGAQAATFSLDPVSRSVSVGDQFEVKVNLDAAADKTNQAQATITFPADKLELVGVSPTSLFPSNQYDTESGIVQVISGEDTGVDYVTGSHEWFTLVLKATAAGTAELRFAAFDSFVLELETVNNLLDLTNLPAGSYTISSGGEPDPTATPIPTATPTSGGDGSSSGDSGGGGEGGGSGCNQASPSTPVNLRAVPGLNNGEVALFWDRSDGADHYGVVFGWQSGIYEYGATDVGNVTQYTVRSLTPGGLYYFAVFAGNGCASSGFSNEASTRAKGVVATAGGTGAKAIVTKQPTAEPTPTPVHLAPPDFQPIGEVLPGADVDTGLPTLVPTATPTAAPVEQKATLPDYLLYGLAVLLIVILFIIVAFLLSRDKDDRRKHGNTIRTNPSDFPTDF